MTTDTDTIAAAHLYGDRDLGRITRILDGVIQQIAKQHFQHDPASVNKDWIATTIEPAIGFAGYVEIVGVRYDTVVARGLM